MTENHIGFLASF